MDEMKSALERALERADRMGKLSPEEMQRQNEARYIPAGEAIAQRFFEHGQISILAEQLDKLENDGKSIAIHSALDVLIKNVGLENRDITERALEGIIGLQGSKTIADVADGVMALFGQYVWQKKLLYEENSQSAGKEVKERMATTGISGSAIAGINLENNEEWAEKANELRSEFDARLHELKQALGQSLNSG